jgi:hypothetical protein
MDGMAERGEGWGRVDEEAEIEVKSSDSALAAAQRGERGQVGLRSGQARYGME